MTVYPQMELRCDGIPGDPYGCEPPIYEISIAAARAAARRAGWLTGRGSGKDFCPDHRPDRQVTA